MFFANFITTWIDERNKFHPPIADSDANPVRKGVALNLTFR